MKKTLTASVLLNLALMLCLVAVLKQRNPQPSPLPSDLAQPESPVETEIASNPHSVSNDPVEQPAPSQYSLSTVTPTRRQSQEHPAVLPLVFQQVDLSQLDLNPDQLQAIEDLRQRFLDEIGGLGQNPGDPAYSERWLKSQPQIDDDLRGMIGFAAFQNYQIKAVTVVEESR